MSAVRELIERLKREDIEIDQATSESVSAEIHQRGICEDSLWGLDVDGGFILEIEWPDGRRTFGYHDGTQVRTALEERAA